MFKCLYPNEFLQFLKELNDIHEKIWTNEKKLIQKITVSMIGFSMFCYHKNCSLKSSIL